MQPDSLNPETWLIETGDGVIRKMASTGAESLSDFERAVYHFWVVDYAIRNSGTLTPMEEICPSAASDLRAFATTPHLTELSQWLAGVDPDSDVLDEYWERFPLACVELQELHAGE